MWVPLGQELLVLFTSFFNAGKSVLARGHSRDKDTGMKEQSMFRVQPFGVAAVQGKSAEKTGQWNLLCVSSQTKKGLKYCAKEFGFWLCGQLRPSLIFKQRSVVFRLRFYFYFY